MIIKLQNNSELEVLEKKPRDKVCELEVLEGLNSVRVRKGGGTEVPWELEFANGTQTKSVNAYDGGKWT